jgi:CO/xanthine dehydrogenase Mo-binding subunit
MSQQQKQRPEQTETEHVGEAVPRTDAPPKVRGEAVYTADMMPSDTLHAKLVKSQVAHARITSLDTSAAEALPGVRVVATADDVPDTRRGAHILDQPIFAEEKVRYIGEPIAIVAAEDEETATEAVGQVDVGYEPLDEVTDLEEAFRPNPPAVVHENLRDYEFTVQGDPRYGRREHVSEGATRPNLMYTEAGEEGGVADAMEAADHVVESEYEVKPFQHCAMEPHVAIAHAAHDGVTLWSSQQVPHQAHSELCLAYPDIEPSELTIKTPYVGGGFGGKETPFVETRVLAAALQTSRPVKLELTRSEEFTTSVSRPQATVKIRDAVSDDGDLLARDGEVLFNVGAYNEQMFKAACSGPNALFGSYDIPNVRWESHAVYTNRPPYGAFRGFGKPEVNWGVERHMNKVAEKIGLDPLEYRSRNLLREGDENVKGEEMVPADTEGCLREPVERLREIDIAVEYPEYTSSEWEVGLGFAYGTKPVSRASAAVTLYVKKDMNVQVQAGAPDIGQGSDTMLKQVTAEAFDIGIEDVSLTTGDTDRTPYDRGPTGSRFTYHTGNAILKAANEIKQKMFKLAAKRFGGSVTPEVLETSAGQIFPSTEPENSIHVNELFSTFGQQRGVSNTMLKEGGELVGTATYDAREGGEHHAFWTPVGQAALVAVNTVTGKADILKFVTVCDAGKAINPKNVEQQLEGGAAQGISSALFEEIVYDGGRIVNPNFKDYRIPYATDLDYESETVILETADEEGPFGARGIGEMGVVPAAPAVGNAVVAALDTEFDTIPVTPERVVAALTE